MTRTIRLFGGALLCAVIAWAATAQAPQSTLFKEARITVNERARAPGYLRVRIQPQGGTAREATLAINDGMSENNIAQGLTAALKATIGTGYEVDLDGGEKVKIRKANGDAADFTVEISFSAPGITVILDN